MQFISGTSAVLQSKLMSKMARYRFRIFVEILGWKLQCPDGYEYDEFDHSRTVYVVAIDSQEAIVGVARLLPTTGPYLLAKIFPDLWDRGELPNSSAIWELSRFACIDLASSANQQDQFSSPRAVELLDAALDCAKVHGASELITVSPLGVERLLCQAGYRIQRAGTPTVIDGSKLVSLRFPQLSASNSTADPMHACHPILVA